MGRIVVADDRVQKFIELLYSLEHWTIGFVIGQQTSARDCVVHLVRSPLLEDDAEASSSWDRKQRTDTPRSLVAVDELWLATHAKQAVRMLPGGLDMLGVFVCAPPAMVNAGQMKLKQIVYAVHKVVSRSQSWAGGLAEHSHRMLLHICPTTRTVTCRTFDIADNKSGASPAEWRYQSGLLDRWLQLEASVSLDETFSIPLASTNTKLANQIQNGIGPLCRSIQEATATIDGRLLPADNLLDPAAATQHSHSAGKKARRQRQAQPTPTDCTHTVHLYTHSAAGRAGSGGQPVVWDCAAQIRLRGTLCARAFVDSRASVAEACRAIKQDVLRSIVARCELVCEDLLQAEEEQDPKVLYEMPLRAFGRLADNTCVVLCDYMFQDETPADSIDRFRELVDLVLDESGLELACERLPTDQELAESDEESVEAAAARLDTHHHMQRTSQHATTTYIGAAVGALVAAAVGALSAFYLSQE